MFASLSDARTHRLSRNLTPLLYVNLNMTGQVEGVFKNAQHQLIIRKWKRRFLHSGQVSCLSNFHMLSPCEFRWKPLKLCDPNEKMSGRCSASSSSTGRRSPLPVVNHHSMMWSPLRVLIKHRSPLRILNHRSPFPVVNHHSTMNTKAEGRGGVARIERRLMLVEIERAILQFQSYRDEHLEEKAECMGLVLYFLGSLCGEVESHARETGEWICFRQDIIDLAMLGLPTQRKLRIASRMERVYDCLLPSSRRS